MENSGERRNIVKANEISMIARKNIKQLKGNNRVGKVINESSRSYKQQER